MVVIRLSRGGSKKRPYFNVVVAESSKKRDGRFIERVGFYNPSARGGAETLRLESERIEYWQSNGAQLSETVNRIVKLNAKGPDGLVAMKNKDEAKALLENIIISKHKFYSPLALYFIIDKNIIYYYYPHSPCGNTILSYKSIQFKHLVRFL